VYVTPFDGKPQSRFRGCLGDIAEGGPTGQVAGVRRPKRRRGHRRRAPYRAFSRPLEVMACTGPGAMHHSQSPVPRRHSRRGAPCRQLRNRGPHVANPGGRVSEAPQGANHRRRRRADDRGPDHPGRRVAWSGRRDRSASEVELSRTFRCDYEGQLEDAIRCCKAGNAYADLASPVLAHRTGCNRRPGCERVACRPAVSYGEPFVKPPST
jgi:hypothetical protein